MKNLQKLLVVICGIFAFVHTHPSPEIYEASWDGVALHFLNAIPGAKELNAALKSLDDLLDSVFSPKQTRNLQEWEDALKADWERRENAPGGFLCDDNCDCFIPCWNYKTDDGNCTDGHCKCFKYPPEEYDPHQMGQC